MSTSKKPNERPVGELCSLAGTICSLGSIEPPDDKGIYVSAQAAANACNAYDQACSLIQDRLNLFYVCEDESAETWITAKYYGSDGEIKTHYS